MRKWTSIFVFKLRLVSVGSRLAGGAVFWLVEQACDLKAIRAIAIPHVG